MNHPVSILSINASDTTGRSGMQADVKTVTEMGCRPLSAITAISTYGSLGVQHVSDLPAELVQSQVRSLLANQAPDSVKVGLLRDAAAMASVGLLLEGRGPVVCAPGISSSDGRRLVSDEGVEALRRHVLVRATLLVVRCPEAELLLSRSIGSDDDMVAAAKALCQLGPKWVMLRGGLQSEGRCTALLYGPDTCRFFVSYNVEGWAQHGVGGTLSAAIATRLAMGDDVPTAVTKAHDYLHTQVVYAVSPISRHLRPSDLYNQYLSLIAQHYRTTHDVAFYADQLAVTDRYLRQVTSRCVGKSPKEVMAEYLIREARMLFETTRLTVQEVSLRLGFSNQSAFCRFVKAYTGQTPSQLRGGV